jgi:hypothetical protein
MLIDFRALFSNFHAAFELLKVAVIMITVATVSKYIAAMFTQYTFKYTQNEKRIIFGLSNSQAAATLAAVMIGYEVILPDGTRLLGESILNGSILMILVTCTIASFWTEKGATNIAAYEVNNEDTNEDTVTEKILIPVNHPDTVEDLVNLGLIMKSKQYKDNIYALSVISSGENDPEHEKKSQELIDKAAKIVAATDQILQEVIRYDISISNGICNIVKERKISDMIMGLHHKMGFTDSYFGKLTETILMNCLANIYIYHSVQPINTLKQFILVIPEKAEREPCFNDFMQKIWNFADNTGIKFIVFASQAVNNIFKQSKDKHSINVELINFTDWEDFLFVTSKLDVNSGLLIYMSRPGSANRIDPMNKISKYLNKYFAKYNYILFYPEKGKK